MGRTRPHRPPRGRVHASLARPNPDRLNHALARSIVVELRQGGHAFVFHDPYDERFEPCLTASEIATRASDDALVERHAAELQAADGRVVVPPMTSDATGFG